MNTRGVITAANEKYAPTLKALVCCCKMFQVPIDVVDHGLTDQTKNEIITHGASIIQDDFVLPRIAQKKLRGTAPPRAWGKPKLCLNSRFDETIWIDSDAVSVRGLPAMFELIPFVTRETFVKRNMIAAFYRDILKILSPELPNDYVRRIYINSGVFGFRKSDKWLQEWERTCAHVVTQQHILDVATVRDQSALVAVLCNLAVEDLPNILQDVSYNCAADCLLNFQAKRRKRYETENIPKFIAELKKNNPLAKVVHFMGNPKPWAV